MAGPILRLVVLRTGQLERLREFYTTFGIEFAAERHGSGPLHYAGTLGAAVLELYPVGEPHTPADTTTRLGFAVEDLNGVMRTLAAAGVQIVRPATDSDWGRRAIVLDPDGRSVELYQA